MHVRNPRAVRPAPLVPHTGAQMRGDSDRNAEHVEVPRGIRDWGSRTSHQGAQWGIVPSAMPYVKPECDLCGCYSAHGRG